MDQWMQPKRQARKTSPTTTRTTDQGMDKGQGSRYVPLLGEAEESSFRPMKISTSSSAKAETSGVGPLKLKRKRSPTKSTSKGSSPRSESPPQSKVIIREDITSDADMSKQLVLYAPTNRSKKLHGIKCGDQQG